MWGVTIIVSLLTILVVIAWRFFNWVWLRPRQVEKMLRKQGLKGNPYRFLFGDAMEAGAMYAESYSKPIGINDCIVPRTMPYINKIITTYGEDSFMWHGPRPMVFINDAELMKVVMNKHTTFHKSFKVSNPIFRRLIGGLIRYEGDTWSKSRKKLNPLFHIDKLKDIVPSMNVQAERIMKEWISMLPNDGTDLEKDIYHYMQEYTGSVVSPALFGIPYGGNLKRAFHIVSELTVISNQAQPFSVPGEQFVPTERYRKANEMEKELWNTVTSMIDERIKRRERGESRIEGDLFGFLVDELQDPSITKREREMIVFEIVQQCKLFFIAGSETTSNLIAWSIVMLAIHTEWQARAREEVFQVVGKDKPVSADDINNLKILTMIINEVLRLYPPAVELSRVVDEETSVGEYSLPKGTMVMLPIIFLHRNPRIWGKDALEFKPDRFAEGAVKAANGHSAFIPFGWGVRTCIGSNLAVREAKVFLSILLRNISFDISPKYQHAPRVSLNLHPQYGTPLLLRKLQQ